MNSLWTLLAIIAGAGAIGGLINALISDNGFLLPKREQADTNTTIIRPGWLGNVFVGAVAATISWGLYGSLAGKIIAGSGAGSGPAGEQGITLSALVGAMLVGVGGARWLTNEVDKKLLRAAASVAAGSDPAKKAASEIALASPANALNIAKGMTKSGATAVKQ